MTDGKDKTDRPGLALSPSAMIIEAIMDEKNTRDQIVPLYAMSLSILNDEPGYFGMVNKAIVSRWSESSLSYIKEGAYKIYYAAEDRQAAINKFVAELQATEGD